MIEINQLSIVYPDGKKALDDISLTIADGETVALVGANGAGKSSLLLSMVGVVSISAGRIAIDGLEINKKSVTDIRSKIGIVFQNPDDMLFMTRVYDDIAFGPRNYKVPEEEVQLRVEGVLAQLGIEHLKDRAPHKMSGGEKRSAAIACILSMNPSVILLDEPTSFLDPKARRTLMRALQSLNLTKIIATHDLDMALELCERAVILKNGKVFADGKASVLLQDEKLMTEAGLELPFCLQKIEL